MTVDPSTLRPFDYAQGDAPVADGAPLRAPQLTVVGEQRTANSQLSTVNSQLSTAI
ncbi:hypothetical protein L2I57_003265 [Tychonema sp. BBK16]